MMHANLQERPVQYDASIDAHLLLPIVPLDSSKYAAHVLLPDQMGYWAKTDIFNHAMMVAYLVNVMEYIGLFETYPADDDSEASVVHRDKSADIQNEPEGGTISRADIVGEFIYF
jgi:hypothetical protein